MWIKQSHTIKTYTERKLNISGSDLELFLNDLDNMGTIKLDTKLSDLADPYLILLQLKCITKGESIKEFITSDAGMHAYNLKLLYSILRKFLEKGNACLIFSYPFFDYTIAEESFSKDKIIMLDNEKINIS